MNNYLSLLTVLWLIFAVSHSLLADLRIKNAFYGIFRLTPVSYRVFYNLFAFLFLTAIIYLQVITPASFIFEPNNVSVCLSLLMGVVGLSIMLLCVAKYFRQLSGIFTESAVPKLETGGLHQYVRHPLYLGTIVFIAGLLLYFPYTKNAVAAFIVIFYTIIGTFLEEKKLVATFGDDYKKYQQHVPMIFPWPRPGKRKELSA